MRDGGQAGLTPVPRSGRPERRCGAGGDMGPEGDFGSRGGFLAINPGGARFFGSRAPLELRRLDCCDAETSGENFGENFGETAPDRSGVDEREIKKPIKTELICRPWGGGPMPGPGRRTPGLRHCTDSHRRHGHAGHDLGDAMRPRAVSAFVNIGDIFTSSAKKCAQNPSKILIGTKISVRRPMGSPGSRSIVFASGCPGLTTTRRSALK
jgi:hypothetical protein